MATKFVETGHGMFGGQIDKPKDPIRGVIDGGQYLIVGRPRSRVKTSSRLLRELFQTEVHRETFQR